jgi:IclR family acetate operon transcriptional repressor
MAILGVLAQHPDGIAPSALAAALDLPVSTCHRLLATLEEIGFVHRWATRGRYSVGYRLYELAGQSGSIDSIALSAARETMEQLNDDLGETCNLARREGLLARYVFQVAPTTAVRLFTTVGSAVPLHSTGVGKVLLTDAPSEVVDTVTLDMKAWTATTITDPDDLRLEIERIKERGYALDNEEHQEGIMCVAVPVFTYTGAVHAALSVAGPASRIDRVLEDIIRATMAAGREISLRLGWQPESVATG